MAIIHWTRWRFAINLSGMDEMNLHASVIKALGGKAVLARALGLGSAVVTKWHVRGIPAQYWHDVVELADGLEPQLTVNRLRETKPSTAHTRPEATA